MTILPAIETSGFDRKAWRALPAQVEEIVREAVDAERGLPVKEPLSPALPDSSPNQGGA